MYSLNYQRFTPPGLKENNCLLQVFSSCRVQSTILALKISALQKWWDNFNENKLMDVNSLKITQFRGLSKY